MYSYGDDLSCADDPDNNDHPDQRKIIISRIDRRLLPICGLITSVSLIDRTNVSNAAIAGMNEDLHLGPGGSIFCHDTRVLRDIHAG
ncbi:hypothetical protein ASPBRDRAFT_666373 [Aspergillus brasiliensis CBS 101740]|uniref:Uncharacterized protein n=1 Tax=Aspergillus brasiliensis (strain CBS 101740 / IMI 381727 / IBT 21946) TaxID=767769 RepID=A0A1L9U349_ASPBC|nr:hypothetical protein ASPBRDRAFT_666373 [Aspergillus brasiliensis CBS 101740]